MATTQTFTDCFISTVEQDEKDYALAQEAKVKNETESGNCPREEGRRKLEELLFPSSRELNNRVRKNIARNESSRRQLVRPPVKNGRMGRQEMDNEDLELAKELVHLECANPSDAMAIRVAIGQVRRCIVIECDPTVRCKLTVVLDVLLSCLPPRQEMDSMEAGVASLLTTSVGGVIEKGVGLVGRSIKQAFGVDHDSPAILKGDGEQLALCDLPCEVLSVAFKSGDVTGDMRSNFSQDAGDVHDLLARCQIKSLLTLVNWTTAEAVGTELLATGLVAHGWTGSCVVGPSAPFAQVADSGFRRMHHTALSACSMMYQRWRGSLRFTVETLGTRFHQGQLYLAYQPFGFSEASAVPTLAQARNCLAASIDLQITNRTEFIVPWNRMNAYENLPESPSTNNPGGNSNNAMGYLALYVQNPLTGPASVANNIDINIWIQAEPDFEFIMPRNITDGIYINGTWQMERSGELLVDQKESPPSNLPKAGLNTQTKKHVCAATNIQPADLTTIGSREYLLTTGITWTTSQAAESVLYTFDVAALFGNSDLALRGLFLYHNFVRCDFEVTLRMNANPFMQGMLAIFHVPATRGGLTDAYWAQVKPTVNQLPCGFFTPQTDTEVTLRFPWTNRREVLNTDIMRVTNSALMGQIKVYVYNQLRSGTGGPTQLTGALFGRLVDPYIGVKRADFLPGAAALLDAKDINVRQEMEQGSLANPPNTSASPRGVLEDLRVGGSQGIDGSSDTQTGDAVVGRAAPAMGPDHTGYIPTRHMNVLELLRRPDLLALVPIANNAANPGAHRAQLYAAPIGYPSAGRTQRYIRTMYHAWSGTMRYKFVSNVTHADSETLYFKPIWNGFSTAPNTTVSGIADADWDPYVGVVTWKPCLETTKTVAVPYYSNTIMKYNFNAAVLPPQDVYNGDWQFAFLRGTAAENTERWVDVYQSIGDDFRMYYMMPFGPTRTVVAVDVETGETEKKPLPVRPIGPENKPIKVTDEDIKEALQQGWLRDLTQEGVEPNPGPNHYRYSEDINEEESDSSDEECETTNQRKSGLTPAQEREIVRILEESTQDVKDLSNPCGFLSKFLARVCSFFERTKKTGENFCVSKTMTEIKKRAIEAKDTIMEKIMPVLVWLLDFVLNIYTICTDARTSVKMMALTSLAAKCVMGYAHGSKLLEQLNEVFQPVRQEMEWDAGKFAIFAGSLSTVVVAGAIGLLGYGMCKTDAKNIRDLTAWKVSESAACLSKLTSGVRAAPELWRMCKDAMQVGFSYLVEGKNIYEDWYEQNKERLKVWQSEVDAAFMTNKFDNNSAFKWDPKTPGKSNFMYLCEYSKVAAEIRVHSAGVRAFPITLLRTAEKVLDRHSVVQKAYDYANGRMEPVGIYVCGKAGCGKSYAWTKIFPFLVMDKCGLTKGFSESLRQVYSVPTNPNQQYMDGYMAQHWVSYDDFGAGTEDLDVLQIINMISVAVMPVNMADLMEKKTTFESRFVCVTSNQTGVQGIVSVKDKTALIRRFPVSINVTANSAFSTDDKVDMEKVSAAMLGLKTKAELLTLVDKIWTFRRQNIWTGSGGGDIVSPSQIVNEIVATYQKRMQVDTEVDTALARLEMEQEDLMSLFSSLSPRQRQVRVKAETVFHDAVSDALGANAPKIVRRACTASDHQVFFKYMMEGRRLQKKEELDFVAAQRILQDVKDSAFQIGWLSWGDMCDEMQDVSPGKLNNPALYTKVDRVGFLRFLKTLMSVEPVDRAWEGPPRKRWVGLLKWAGAITGITITATGIGYGTYQFLKWLFGKMSDYMCPKEEGPQYEKGNARQLHRVAPKVSKIPSATAYGAQQQVEPLRDIHVSISRAIRRIQIRGNEKGMSCLALDNRTLLVPRHFYLRFREIEGAVVELERKDRSGKHLGFVAIRIECQNIEQVEEEGLWAGKKDILVVKLIDEVCQHAANIRHLLMPYGRKVTYGGTEFASWWLDTTGGGVPAIVDFKRTLTYANMKHLAGKISGVSGYGSCGRPYVIRNMGEHSPLIGLHALGFEDEPGKVGVADFTKEAVLAAEERITNRLKCPLVTQEMDFGVASIKCEEATSKFWTSDVEMHGYVSMNGQPLRRSSPAKTDFTRTKLQHPDWQDEFVPTAKAVVYHDGEMTHPLITNAQKFSNDAQATMPLRCHKLAVDYMKEKMGVGAGLLELNEFEMINGRGTMQPIVLSTSSGYIQQYLGGEGKKSLFDQSQIEVEGVLQPMTYTFSEKAANYVIPVLNCSFLDHLRKQEERVRNGEEPVTIWTATNKDELVSREKARIGKTRVFVQPGLEITLLLRKFFGHFIDAYKARAGFSLCHGIGMDKEVVWGAYLDEFESVGLNGFDLDYVNYDGSLCNIAVEAFLDVADHYYQGQGCLARRAVFASVIRSVMIVGELTAEKEVGNCSGNPMTDMLNSITNWYLILTGYIMARWVRFGGELSLEGFESCVRALTYGDDVLISASDETLEWFNRRTLVDHVALLGMKATSAQKTEDIVEKEPLSQLTFLKSPFVRRGAYVAAPLPKKVIHREVMWQKKQNDGDAGILRQKIETAVRDMAHHGEAEVELFMEQLCECDVDISFDFQLWEWEMRDKQEFARVESVDKKEKCCVERFLLREEDCTTDYLDRV